MSILDKIILNPLTPDCFIDQKFNKSMIFLHHTASGGNASSVKDYWEGNKNKVSTPFIISRGDGKTWKDGDIMQCFGSAKGCWHLGLTAKHLAAGGPHHKTSSFLNMNSIGIELCNYGYLIEKGQALVSYDGTVISESNVCELDTPYRGYKHYQSYTNAQLDSTKQLLQYLSQTYNIPLTYQGIEMFEINKDCLCGKSGVWTHTSVRPIGEKYDCYPSPKLIEMLKSL